MILETEVEPVSPQSLDDLRGRGISDFRSYFKHPEDLANCASMVKILNDDHRQLSWASVCWESQL